MIVLVLATIIFFYSKSTGPKPVASAVVASAALQQGANNVVLSDDKGNLSSIPLSNISPKGMVVAWSGDKNSIPQGWTVCDGKNGTPDLRGKFIWGHNHADDKDPARWNNNYKATGGSEQVVIGIEQMPRHNHPISAVQWGPGPGYSGGGNKIGGAATSGEVGGGQPLTILPPFYVLIYIMKL